ncbi:MAG: sulfite exporter TauE/SafE family protein [Candidatus Krumholzibacteria bacterium]|nr:sulfite exporter TauE/SafE family protein [Candidatus Krumholzibacteria bacterium]
MDSYWVALGSAVWLGILTSISPCPLATNIAAITYIGKRVDRPGMVLLSGLMYTVGRMVSYITLGVLVVTSVLSIPEVAMFLQQNMNKFLGPILIIVGILLLGILNIRFPGGGVSDKLTARIEKWGIWGAGALGLLFALSFCPVSATLFFGSLIPLAIDHQSSIVMPTVYGIGTALPVVVFALVVAFGAHSLGKVYDNVTRIARWARRITGVVFVGVGIYLTLVYIFEVL